MYRYTARSRGFTLIELLVVIAIIGLLSSIVLASLSEARARGRYATAVEQMRAIAIAAEIARGSYSCVTVWTGQSYTSPYACDVDAGRAPSFVGSTMGAWPQPPCPGWAYDWENWTVVNNNIMRVSLRTRVGGPTLIWECVAESPTGSCGDDGENHRDYTPKALYCNE